MRWVLLIHIIPLIQFDQVISKAEGIKDRKSIVITINNYYKISILLFFNICALLLISELKLC